MENNVKKNILFLVIAGFVLVLLNAAIFMATRNGQLAPVDDLMLWGIFAILNVCSLLWAVSLLGLQPMVIAVSYVAGGLLAFQGVRFLPNVNIAEVTTAGATYGAFGALAVSHATTKVRLAFFHKTQTPFIFIILVLLVIDGFLNSRVSAAGWGLIVNALIFPFVFSGVMVGLIWMVLVRMGIARNTNGKLVEERAEPLAESTSEGEGMATDQLMIQIPESVEENSLSEPVAETMEAVKPVSEPEPAVLEVSETPAAPLSVAEEPVLDSSASTEFFPLEIDKTDDLILEKEDSSLMDLAASIAESAPEQVMETESVIDEFILPEDLLSEKVSADVLDSTPDPVVEVEPEETVEPDQPEEDKEDTSDWLSGHLDLLNKLGN